MALLTAQLDGADGAAVAALCSAHSVRAVNAWTEQRRAICGLAL